MVYWTLWEFDDDKKENENDDDNGAHAPTTCVPMSIVHIEGSSPTSTYGSKR